MARRTLAILVLGDLLMFVLFALLGSASHGESRGGVLLRTVVPFGVAWVALGALAGVFRPGVHWWRVLGTWLVSGVVGLLLRRWWFDRPLEADFAAIALGVQGAFLLAWRGLFALWLRRHSARQGSAP